MYFVFFMMKRRALILLTFFYFIICASNAQLLDSTLARYSSKYQQERIYMHYDKAAYGSGETIWFKAYLMEGMLPGESSKTLYIDWVDEKGGLLYHTSAPIVQGITYGQFDIPEAYNGRLIQVTAYTKWALNFDTAFLYKKTLQIIPATAATKATSFPATVTSINFFPEGGDLVEGIINKVAFKATDQWGRPVVVSGVVQKIIFLLTRLKLFTMEWDFFYWYPKPA
jgi:hypothetical protein